MPSIDIFQFIERFLAALTGFVYSGVGSYAFLARHPQRGPQILGRRFTSDAVYQAGPLTLLFIVLVVSFAGIELSESGRGDYADFDGADMLDRLIPGWNGHLTPELGAVVLAAFVGTAAVDAWSRIMVACGWPDFANGFPARLRRRQQRVRIIATRYFAIAPLAVVGLLLAADYGVPAALGLDVNPETAVPVTIVATLAVLLCGFGFTHPRLIAAPPSPGAAIVVFGWMLVPAFVFYVATPLATGLLSGYYKPPPLATSDAAAVPLLACTIAPDGAMSATLVVIDTGQQNIALVAAPKIYLKRPRMLFRTMTIDGLADAPYLVLRGGEGRALRLSEAEASDPLPAENLGSHKCHILWDLAGDSNGRYVDVRGPIDDRRPAKGGRDAR